MEVKLVAILLTVFVLFLTFKVIKHLSKILDRKWLEFIDKKELPDESEVIGKVLPVGSKFLKDGKVIKVIEGIKCSQCAYSNAKCVDKKRPVCYNGNYRVHFKYVKR